MKTRLSKMVLCVHFLSLPGFKTQRKSALIHKPWAQIHKINKQHDAAGNTIKYLDINTLIDQNDVSGYCDKCEFYGYRYPSLSW